MDTARLWIRRGRWAAIATLCLFALSPLRADDGPPTKRFAFLVGINEYEHGKLGKLRGPENDVNKLGEILRGNGYTVVVLTGSTTNDKLKATRENIEREMKELLGKVGKDDLVLVAFSGHGVQFQDQNKVFESDAYFCPKDAKPFATQKATLISLNGIYTLLDECKARHRVVLIDACRDDPEAGRRPRGIAGKLAPLPPNSIAILFSCIAGESAYEHPKELHGIFFWRVLEAFRTERAEDLTTLRLIEHLLGTVKTDVALLFPVNPPTQTPLATFKTGDAVLIPGRGNKGIGRAFNGAAYLQSWRDVGHDRAYLEANAPGQLESMRAGAMRGEALAQLALGRCLLSGVALERDRVAGFDWVVKASAQNVPAAQHVLGGCYQLGLGVDRDASRAFDLYRQAANQDYPPAMMSLISCYQSGIGTKPDIVKSAEICHKAAQLGWPSAQFALGRMYDFGRGVERSTREGKLWYQSLLDGKETPLAQFHRGQCYEFGLVVEKNYDKAYQLYRQSADAGVRDAVNEVGACYDIGVGVKDDPAEAFRWFKKAALMDHSKAMLNMGIHYQFGRSGNRDLDLAREWYVKAAEFDNATAMHTLGNLYQDGVGVAQNFATAREWYEKAANRREVRSMVTLGNIYLNGVGVARDPEKAEEWYRKATEDRVGLGHFYLGKLYESGALGKKEPDRSRGEFRKGADLNDASCQNRMGELADGAREAFDWFGKAAEYGSPEGMHNLGKCYLDGRGTDGNDRLAFDWFLRGARSTSVDAAYEVARCYLRGVGTEADRDNGLRWLRRAADQGHEKAKDELKKYQ